MSDGLEILPKTVRDILKVDNDEIIRLCQAGNLPLKQNEKGYTYFTTDDVKLLKRMQDIQNKAKQLEDTAIQLRSGLKKIPANPSDIDAANENGINKQLPAVQNDETIKLLKQITGAVKNIETGVYDKIGSLLDEKLENKLETKLTEKLGGIDDVIMDLVRCKAEAEDMRKQLAENSKEIYALKNELSRFKKVAGNFYIKKQPKDAFEV
ncbi:MAG: hypothetical protein K6C94_07215 [Candidatus Gastranaerophilales bacterium]|nr:hypothetical protein [Candidatus Gastranaerophilales bacterium]